MHLVYQVLLYRFFAKNMENILRIDGAIGELLPRFYLVSGLNMDMNSSGNRVLSFFCLFISYSQAIIFNNYFTGYAGRNSLSLGG